MARGRGPRDPRRPAHAVRLVPSWEIQILAAAGYGVFYANPRGSEGYGEAFNDANHRDWATDRCATCWPASMPWWPTGWRTPSGSAVTGGSYGGYLTNWIVGHDHRFRTAMTCRSVSDMNMLFTTGDIAGGDWAALEFDVTPWNARPISVRSRRSRMQTRSGRRSSSSTPNATCGRRSRQGEALFTVLRSHRRPVRLLRVPDETHELTRSGTFVSEGRESTARRGGLVRPLPGQGEARHATTPKVRGGRSGHELKRGSDGRESANARHTSVGSDLTAPIWIA